MLVRALLFPRWKSNNPLQSKDNQPLARMDHRNHRIHIH